MTKSTPAFCSRSFITVFIPSPSQQHRVSTFILTSRRRDCYKWGAPQSLLSFSLLLTFSATRACYVNSSDVGRTERREFAVTSSWARCLAARYSSGSAISLKTATPEGIWWLARPGAIWDGQKTHCFFYFFSRGLFRSRNRNFVETPISASRTRSINRRALLLSAGLFDTTQSDGTKSL